MQIKNCKVNHLVNPLGYAMEKCVFSWTVEESAGAFQTAARIVVKTCGVTAADTGWAELNSLAAPVALELKPRTRYTWTVSVRTDAGEEATSEENWFETAKMEEPWSAQWIGCDGSEARHPIFAKAIQPAGEVAAARLYICGLGVYEASWNGVKIGDEYLAPYCNNYNAWVQYQTYDVTAQLQGEGTLSVELGNGWYNGRFGFNRKPVSVYGDGLRLIAELHLTYADGTEEVIGTDESWTVTRSNITFSNIYDGEHRDDTLPALSAESAVLAAAPKGKLTARYSTPVKAWETLPVKQIIHTPAGETVIDVGQNMTGSFRLRIHEPAGTKIHIQVGEILQQGNFYRDNLRSALAEYFYTSSGEEIVLEPKFTFYGFRYVKIQGISDLKPEDFTALVLYSELPQTAWLSTGSDLVNRLISNTQWGQKGNFLDVPTDCPQRDERMGWTGDAQVFSGTACYLRESYAFFNKYLHDVESEQSQRGGMVPDVVPAFDVAGCSAAWGDAACVIPIRVYEMYGDVSILEQQFGSMCAWVDHITQLDGDDCAWRRHFHYGDWLALDGATPEDLRGGTDAAMVADTQYRHVALLTAKAARILGKTAEAEKYGALADKLLKRIRDEFYTPTGRCAVNTQTGHLLSLRDGTGPNPERSASDLEAKLRSNGGKLATGFVGTPLLCPTLTATGHADLAFDLLLNEEYPGWLYSVKAGATTIWERWNSVDENGVIAENGMNSLNHYSYGSVVEWICRDVAGLTPVEPGFRKAKLAPHVNAYLGKASLRYESAAGTWESAWEVLENNQISYRCTVPFGCSAQLTLPHGGGEYTLTAGTFEKTYTADCPLRPVFSTRTPFADLLANARAKAVLVKFSPQITQLPASMHSMCIRDVAALMGGISNEAMDYLDSVLANI